MVGPQGPCGQVHRGAINSDAGGAPRISAAGLPVPTADYYANFVLGRLALLDGQIRSAEQYLLAAGRTSGDGVLRSYGPNMSLALELLKHGDKQSWQSVQQFI